MDVLIFVVLCLVISFALLYSLVPFIFWSLPLFVVICLAASFGLLYVLVPLVFRKSYPTWSIPEKIGVFSGGSYFIFAFTISLITANKGGEGVMLIYILGFPSVFLVSGELSSLSGIIRDLLIIFGVNSVLIGGMLGGISAFFKKITKASKS